MSARGGTDVATPTRVSRDELERRWALIRAAMADRNTDVLLAQSSDEWYGGYARYLSNLTGTHGQAVTVIFPSEGKITVIQHGPPGRLDVDSTDESTYGIGTILTAANVLSLSYTDQDEASLVAKAMAPYAAGTIGLLGKQQLSASVVDVLRESFPGAQLQDATDVVDPIRAIKSEEEKTFIRATAALQDAVIERVFSKVEAGITEREIAVHARAAAYELGADQGVFFVRRGLGKNASQPNVNQRTPLEPGDLIHLLVETNGPGGYFTHLVRSVALGHVDERAIKELDFILSAQQFTLDRLRPGAAPSAIRAEYDAYMRDHSRPEERRIHCHSQGYDMIERPVIRREEPLPISANMNIACHPSYNLDDLLVWVCSNYLVKEDGVEPLHKFPTEIVVV